MQSFETLRIFNKLKSVYRFNSVDQRKESVAEHSWGCLILADYFLSTAKYKVDRQKVYELLMYHDLIELETGDIPITDEVRRANLDQIYQQALTPLKNKLPPPLDTKFVALFEEFTYGTTREAFFARAIDSLEAEIHELDYKQDWAGWTAEYLLTKKLHRFAEFPEMQEMFMEIVEYLKRNGYFAQDK